MSQVYLNGEYLPREEARVSVEDRGFLLSDGVYEVAPAYSGRFFRLPHHQCRLMGGLEALRIAHPLDELEEVHRQLLLRNGLEDEEVATIYYQVTRGVAPRSHHFPLDPVAPTVYATASAYKRPPRSRWEEGYGAIMVPDRRWSRADLKTISLLPNVLAQQAAAEAGVKDALMVREGVALEGAHNNVFFVFGEQVVTHPATQRILHGITRAYVLELARKEGFQVVERPVQVEEVAEASEIFFTGTTTEIRPTVQVDGRPVGNGVVGSVTRRLYDAFLAGVPKEVGLNPAGPSQG